MGEAQPVRVTSREDYDAILPQYHGMVLNAAAAYGVPEADLEDAAQEVELRFFRKDGLAWFDPEMLHPEPESGWRDGHTGPRKAAFSSYYRRFTYLNMMQEMDRHNNRTNRVRPVEGGDLPEGVEADIADAVTEQESSKTWMRGAQKVCKRLGRLDLARLLDVLADGEERSLRAIAAELSITPRAAGVLKTQLLVTLTEHGYGPESLAG